MFKKTVILISKSNPVDILEDFEKKRFDQFSPELHAIHCLQL